jgi:hypothetical protein
MWIQGKPVEIDSPAEALKYAPFADRTAPANGAGAEPTARAGPQGISADPRDAEDDDVITFFEKADADTKYVLVKLAMAYPGRLPADELKPDGDARRLAQVMAALTKKFGKDVAVIKRPEWKEKARVLMYSLSDAWMRTARQKHWGGS